MERQYPLRGDALEQDPEGWDLPSGPRHKQAAISIFLVCLAVLSLGGPALVSTFFAVSAEWVTTVTGIVFAVLAGAGVSGALHLAGSWSRRGLLAEAREVRAVPQLEGVADGELVRMQGRVILRDERDHADTAVYERTILGKTVHERAMDFALAGTGRGEVWVEVEGARLMHPSGVQLRLGSCTVRVGDLVEVIGWKSRVLDPRLERLEREMPSRAVLRSGRSLPLLIIPTTAPPRALLSA